MQKVIGLAGHIDHGKTALVKALTGVDTDRLEEEKRRGVTIDIGIAFYDEDVTLIDVPGHERFIKNMVTGVSTVDAALLVIAADDGIMPQTGEHLDILRILGVTKIVVALNKIDLVDEDWRDMVAEEVDEFLSSRGYPDTAIIPVSAVKGLGIEALRQCLDDLIKSLQQKDEKGIFRLPIDRVFSVKGFGTVVTGTVLSHEIRKGQSVELFPQQITYPIRGLQSHHLDVDKIQFGDRGAINLGGASVEDLGRGAFLGSPGMFQTGSHWLGRLSVLKHWERPVREADRVHIHVGTGKREARVHLLEANQCQPGQSMWAQFLFEEDISAAYREPVVLRFLSPEQTLGGAELFWSFQQRMKKKDERLAVMDKALTASPSELLQVCCTFFSAPLSRKELARRLGVAESKIHPLLLKPEIFKAFQDEYLPAHIYETTLQQFSSVLTEYHAQSPLGKGLPRESFQAKSEAIQKFVLHAALNAGVLKNQGELWQLAGHQSELDGADLELKRALQARFTATPYTPPPLNELTDHFGTDGKRVTDWMIQHGELVRIDKDMFLLDEQIEAFFNILRSWFKAHEELSVAELREIVPTTRKFLLPMLNYAERKGLLLRDGDVRRWIGEDLSS